MTPSKIALTARLVAVMFCCSGISVYGAGHGGGGFSGGGGHGSSAGGHASSGGRGPAGGAVFRGGNIRAHAMSPYVPAAALRSHSVHGLRSVNQRGSGSRSSSRNSDALIRNKRNSSGTSTRQHQANPDRQTNGHRGHRNLPNHTGLDPQTQQRLRNWQGTRLDPVQARQRHREWSRDHHHGRNWWRRHCNVFVLVDWGFWGWWDGWWFPAWGYDPYYSEYEYDGPIYGYAGLPPDDAVANVQAELQRLGYYTYAVDGKLGPLTQNAINRYQRDHRLPITGTIDPATVGSLGLAR